MKSWIFVLLSLLPILTVSCKMGPNYRRPTVDVGTQFRDASTSETATSSFADLPWWEVFGDKQLQEYIHTALNNNHNLQVAVARVAEARSIVGVVRADLFPQLSGYGNASRQRLSERSNPPAKSTTLQFQTPLGNSSVAIKPPDTDLYANLYQAGLDLSYEVDLWGRLRRATEAARADLLATENARRTLVSALVADVARTYFLLRELDFELQIAERTLGSRSESERLTRMRKEYGAANGLELERATGETGATAATIAAIQFGIAQAENALSILLGRNPGELGRGAALTEQPLIPEIPPGLPSSLLERRPDILLAEAQLIAANARIGEAKALFFPRISLTGFLGYESDELNKWFVQQGQTFGMAGHLAQPIFSGGRLYFNYKAVKARRDQAVSTYMGTIQQALREVADALAQRKYSKLEREQRERQVNALVNASELANQRYKGGRSSYLDVLDAEREQFDAELQLAESRLAELLSVVQLYRALGGGWFHEPASASAAGMPIENNQVEPPAEN